MLQLFEKPSNKCKLYRMNMMNLSASLRPDEIKLAENGICTLTAEEEETESRNQLSWRKSKNGGVRAGSRYTVILCVDCSRGRISPPPSSGTGNGLSLHICQLVLKPCGSFVLARFVYSSFATTTGNQQCDGPAVANDEGENLRAGLYKNMNEDEWDEILQRFREEGLDTNLPDDHKLLYVWRWLVDAETNCISLRHQLDKLSRRQSDELEEIRSCMEQMCNAWEVKVSKLEEENKRFQEQLNFSGQNSGRIVSQEIQQMVLEEGLSDIVELGVIEQFAYLLDERTRLRTKLEQEIAARRKCEQLVRISSNLPDCLKLSSPYIQRILDRQKDEYEEEIRHQQETMKHVKEQLKQVHEDELQRLKSENENLNTELKNTSQKLQELVTHIANESGKDASCLPWVQHILDGTHVNEMKSLREEVDQLRGKSQDQQKQIREQGETIRMLERTNKQLEIDNETLAYKLSESLAQFDELEDQLRREASRVRRESLFKQISAKDNSNTKPNINKILDNRPSSQDPAFGDQVKQLKEESSSLKEQLETVQQQLEIMSHKYQQHKEKYREKMYRLRDLQDQEHREWKERFENCEKELSILREMLAREQEWRVLVEADCRKLKNDNQLLKNGILEKEKPDKTLDVSALQREVEKLKSAASRPSSASGSPSRRSVWPVIAHPKKW